MISRLPMWPQAAGFWGTGGGDARGIAGSSKETQGRQLSPQRVTAGIEDMVQPFSQETVKLLNNLIGQSEENSSDVPASMFMCSTKLESLSSKHCQALRCFPSPPPRRFQGSGTRVFATPFGLLFLMAGWGGRMGGVAADSPWPWCSMPAS